MILVVGATGLVGLDVCERLRQRGERVRAFVRSTSDKEKKARLHRAGAELIEGDLKSPKTLERACEGVTAIVSTASATLSRQEGDSIETVDRVGQRALVDIAEAAGARRFIYLSFRNNTELEFPLSVAKAEVEERLHRGTMDYTILHAACFMEIWLSPALGFDYAAQKATVFGGGSNRMSWVSSSDVAAATVACLGEPQTHRQTIRIGGPEALSTLEVIDRFEAAGWDDFTVQHLSEEQLRAAFEAADDPLQKTFAALQLFCAYGDEIDMGPTLRLFPLQLTSVRDYALSLKTARGYSHGSSL